MRWSWKRPSIPERYQPWLKENWWWMQSVILAAIVFVIAIAFERNAWLDWVGFKDKTIWEWLELLGVPLSLAILGYLIQQQQQKHAEALAKEQREIAADEEKEEVLQTYFDRLSTLLIDKNLLAIAVKIYPPTKEKPETQLNESSVSPEQRELFAAAVDVIRARTLSILRRLADDPDRKASVIQFLIEAEVISKAKIDLSGANLSGANLSGVNLSYANLRNANLIGVNLSYANLIGVDLRDTNLRGTNLIGVDLRHASLGFAKLSSVNLIGAQLVSANLFGVNLSGADLRNANLIGADLSGADLSGVNLSGANLSYANLSSANLSSANLSSANLSSANLSYANLSYANLSSANLSSAILIEASLSNTQNLTNEQLEGKHPPLICNTSLPPDITIDPNRDWDRLAATLHERYPGGFKTLEEAEKWVEKRRPH